jgi:hypothetical protein
LSIGFESDVNIVKFVIGGIFSSGVPGGRSVDVDTMDAVFFSSSFTVFLYTCSAALLWRLLLPLDSVFGEMVLRDVADGAN